MSDAQQTATPFPTPPPFYKHFTKQNTSQLQRLRREQGHGKTRDDTRSAGEQDVDVLQLPSEFRYLIPPQPPTDGRWRSFGTSHDLNAHDPTLEENGVEQLFPDHPSVKLLPQPHLIALARSLLTTFLSMSGVLAQDPSLYEEKVQDLRTMAINMQNLIGSWRPHQARETLILLMEERLDKIRAEIKAVIEAQENVEQMLQGLQNLEVAHAQSKENSELSNGVHKHDATAQKVQDRQRVAWAALEDQTADDEAAVNAATAQRVGS